MADQLRILIVGAGKMGFFHAQAALSIPQCKVVGIVSRRLTSAQKLSSKFIDKDIKAFDDLRKAVEETSANAAIIAVSHFVTAKVLEDCLSLGLNCLVEKPVSIKYEEIDHLIELQESKNLKVMVGVNRRFYNTIQNAYIKSKYHGKLNSISLVASDFPLYYKLRSSFEDEVYDHWPVMNTIHGFDLLSLFGEGLDKVIHKEVSTGDELIISAVIKGKNGLIMNFLYSEGSGTLNNWKFSLLGKDYNMEFSPLESLRYSSPFPGTDDELYKEESEFKPGIKEQLMYFSNVVVANLEVKYPSSNLQDHKGVLKIMNELFNNR